MSLNRYNKARDRNESDIVKILRGMGLHILWTVDSTIDFGQRLKRDERLLIRSIERAVA